MVDQVGEPSYQELGLARTGAGYYQLRPFGAGNGVLPVAGMKPMLYSSLG